MLQRMWLTPWWTVGLPCQNAVYDDDTGADEAVEVVEAAGVREDACRVRTGHAAANLSVIRRFALGLLRREAECRRGIETKRLKCALSEEYREKVLFIT